MIRSILKHTLAIAVTSALSFNMAVANDKFAELDDAVAQVKQPKAEKIAEFHSYVNAYLDEYEKWRDEYTQSLDAERSKRIAAWGEGEVSDETKNVEYSEDGNQKTVVDFESNTATVSVIVDQDADLAEVAKNLPDSIEGQKVDLESVQAEEAAVLYSAAKEKKEKSFIIDQTQQQMNELDVQAERLIRSNTGVPDSYIYERAYKKKVALINQAQERILAQSTLYKSMRLKHGIPEELPVEADAPEIQAVTESAQTAKVDTKPTKPVVAEEKAAEAVAKAPKATTPVAKPVPADKPAVKAPVAAPTAKKVVSYKVKLPNNSLKARASKYQPLAEKESKNWEVDAALIMAIMHSESAFRPDAKSHVPAFGLMQVVPTSAGHDVNKQVRNIDAPMKVADLYQPTINVETGTAYLDILNSRYLKSIKNDESRLYCTIAAYNTGAGNVARAFNKDKSTKIGRASKVINNMTPDEVYNHLIKNLPYDETKNYLKKVNGRIALYRK